MVTTLNVSHSSKIALCSNNKKSLFASNDSELIHLELFHPTKKIELKQIISATNVDFIGIVTDFAKKTTNKEETILKCANLLNILDAQVSYKDNTWSEQRTAFFQEFSNHNQEFRALYEKIQQYSLDLSLLELNPYQKPILNDLSNLKEIYNHYINSKIVKKELISPRNQPSSIMSKITPQSILENGEYKAKTEFCRKERENIKSYFSQFIHNMIKKIIIFKISHENNFENDALTFEEKENIQNLSIEVIDKLSSLSENVQREITNLKSILNQTKIVDLRLMSICNKEIIALNKKLIELEDEKEDIFRLCHEINSHHDSSSSSSTNTIRLLNTLKSHLDELFDGASFIGKSYDSYLKNQENPIYVLRINHEMVEDIASKVEYIFNATKCNECKIILTPFVNYSAESPKERFILPDHYEIPNLEYFNEINKILADKNIEIYLGEEAKTNIPLQVKGNGDCFISTKLWYQENDVKVIRKI